MERFGEVSGVLFNDEGWIEKVKRMSLIIMAILGFLYFAFRWNEINSRTDGCDGYDWIKAEAKEGEVVFCFQNDYGEDIITIIPKPKEEK